MDYIVLELQEFFNWVLASSAMASVLVGLIFLVKFAVKDKLGANWHYALWLLVVIRLIMPLDIQSSLSIFNAFETSQKITFTQDRASEIQSKEIGMVSGKPRRPSFQTTVVSGY
ncbi:MAG: bla regulator protein blaR1 [Clostridia bacterium]|nr:bla regulator protein blaR1 [Clostridia bacterium]